MESESKNPNPYSPLPAKTARIHGISGSTTSPLMRTRPIRGKKMATPHEPHHLHNNPEEIPVGKRHASADSMTRSSSDLPMTSLCSS